MAKDRQTLTILDRRGKRRRLEVPSPRDGFRHQTQGVLTLVTPEARARWGDSRRPFRSLMFDRAGAIVSSGWPKFFSPGANPEDAADAEADLAQALITRKLDGRLMIRFVWRKGVRWRTRSSFSADDLAPSLERLAGSGPLNDPGYLPGHSLLFEFCSPRTRVVIPYPTESLTLIGAVSHADLSLVDYSQLERIAEHLGVPVVERLPQTGSLAELQRQVDEDLDHEGVAVRFADQQRLIRVKSARYLLAHRMRFELHPRRVVQVLEKRPDLDAAAIASKLGLDAADPLIGYIDERRRAYARMSADADAALAECNRVVSEHSAWSKAQWSEHATTLPAEQALAIAELRAGRPERARAAIDSQLLNERFGDPVPTGLRDVEPHTSLG